MKHAVCGGPIPGLSAALGRKKAGINGYRHGSVMTSGARSVHGRVNLSIVRSQSEGHSKTVGLEKQSPSVSLSYQYSSGRSVSSLSLEGYRKREARDFKLPNEP
jgi:hypothetical protein